MQPPDVNKSEQKQIEAQGFRDFLNRKDETGINWVRRKKDGSCFFLGKENKCRIYSVRPAICRLDPFTIADYDYERNTIELELNFPASCSCVGVSDTETLPVEEISRAAQLMVRKIIALTAKELGTPKDDPRVAAETRSKILRRAAALADLSP